MGYSRTTSRVARRRLLQIVGLWLLCCGAFSAMQAAWPQSAPGYWHASGVQILDTSNKVVRLSGVNWYGFETTDEVAHGLWAQDYKTILNGIKANGYNVVRLPLSNQMVESPTVPGNVAFNNGSGAINTDLQNLNSLQILDKIVAYAGSIGLRIILDNHRSEAGNSAESNGLWYTSTYPESAWINDWQNLANRYLNDPTVVGFDLRNEPHNATSNGACWDCGNNLYDWHLAAERAGNAVLSINPQLLIFVEGTDCYNGDCDWWGGNLEGVRNSPVTLNVANHLVYSPHDYGPNEYGQSWFNSSTTPASLQAVWTKFWAYISQNGTAPVWLGEFGTTNNAADLQSSSAGSQGQWFQTLVAFLSSNSSISWTYWALNGEDSYALLDSNYDPTPASATKQQMLAGIQAAASSSSSSGGSSSSGSSSGAHSSSSSSSGGASSSGSSSGAHGGSSSSGSSSSGSSSGSHSSSSSSSSGGSSSSSSSSGGRSSSSSSGSSSSSSSSGGHSSSSSSSSGGSSSGSSSGGHSSSSSSGSSSSGSSSGGHSSSSSSSGGSASSGSSSGGHSSSSSSGGSSSSGSSSGGHGSSSGSSSGGSSSGSASGNSCQVTYTVNSDWGDGFNVSIVIANTSSVPISDWTLAWSWGGDEQITQSWNGTATQTGKNVSFVNASWDGGIPAGGSIQGVGFNGSYARSNPTPTVFTLNGVRCK